MCSMRDKWTHSQSCHLSSLLQNRWPEADLSLRISPSQIMSTGTEVYFTSSSS